MLNRAVVQPDPKVAFQMTGDMWSAAASAGSLDDLFVNLEESGVMFRIDQSVLPTMAKAPTLGAWELELLRSIENVVRLGHVTAVTRQEIVLADGVAPLTPGVLVVHCAASGLTYPQIVPIWEPDAIRIQSIRAGFPCFAAALIGYVEATRDDDRDRNRLCPPNTFPDRPGDWAWMQVRGADAVRSFTSEPDIAEWANACALNPSRLTPSQRRDPTISAVADHMVESAKQGLPRMAELALEPSWLRH
jgi:hypothetical protein